MNIPELWAELELEQEWRQREIRFLQNQIASVKPEKEQDLFRRAAVLILYAHFEGFCKFAFTVYANAVNSEGITCGEANYAIAAASLSDLFRALREPERKCPQFKKELPDDSALHRFARDREFIEQSDEFEKRRVNIPDWVINTESNLNPMVLKKILYRLGFYHNQFISIEGDIQLLLNYRNGIAHGESKNGIPLNKYNRVRSAAYRVMDTVKAEVMAALQQKLYLRNVSRGGPRTKRHRDQMSVDGTISNNSNKRLHLEI
ncbi:MAG: MAE_28990/MAE_18760 family HEPN-like nuclease [Candidatus Auribacterota bacterium]